MPTPAAPVGRVTLTSDLRTGCGRLGDPCRHPDAPASARLADGPRSGTVARPDDAVVEVRAQAGPGAEPASVGFLVHVCRCTADAEDVLVEAGISRAPGATLVLQGLTGPVRVWVQELNEAGLSRGAFTDVPASPPPSPAS